MHVTSLGAAREFQEGIAVDPLLVGCGVKPHDFDPNEIWVNSIDRHLQDRKTKPQ